MKNMRDNVHTAAGATTLVAVCALIGCVVLASSGAVFRYFVFCLLPLYFVLPRGFLGQGRPAPHPMCPPGITQKHKAAELQDPSHL
jgi:hypothetical protein